MPPLFETLCGDPPAGAPAHDPRIGELCARIRDAEDRDARRRLLESYLGQRVAELVGLRHAAVDAQRPLIEYGMDSLMVASMQRTMERDLGVRLGLHKLMAAGSLVGVAALVDRALAAHDDAWEEGSL